MIVTRLHSSALGRRSLLIAAAAAPLAMPAIRSARAASAPIKLGFVVALTGAFATNAQAINFGFQKALGEINAGGGLLGRMLEAITRDSAAEPTKAVSFTKELLFNNDVDMIGGPTNSGEVLPTLGVVTAAKKIQIISGSVDQLIDPVKYPYAFRCLNKAGQWFTVSVKYTLDGLRRRKVAIINDNSGFGVLAMQSVEHVLKAAGVTPVYRVNADIGQPDMTDEINKARDAGADVVHLWSNSTGFLARVLNARGQQNWNVPVIAIPAVLQEQVANLLTSRAYWANVYSPAYANSVLDAKGNLPPATQTFLDRYKSEVGPFMAAGIYAMLQGYNIPMIYAAGVRKAGTVDTVAVKQALESIPTIDLPYGPFHFSPTDHDGFPDDGMVMVAANSLHPNGGFEAAPAGGAG